jgi:O-antigen/teichoic acid export membrane protein
MGTENTQVDHTLGPPTPGIGRSFLWMVWSAAISVANSVFLWIYLARMRDVEELGRFTIVMGLYSLFVSICALGLPAYMVVEISRRRVRAARGPGSVSSFIANASLLMLASGFISACLMCLFGFWASSSQTVIWATLMLSLGVLPSGLIAVAEATMVAHGRTRLIALVTTFENVLRTVVPIFLIWKGFDLATICMSLAAVRFAALATYGVAAGDRLSAFSFDRTEIKSILSAAPTFVGTIIFSSIIWQGAAVLLGRYSTEVETAKFGAASRFLVPATILLASYADVIQPGLAQIAAKSKKMLAKYLARLLRFPLGLAIIAAVAAPFLSPMVLTFLFGERYADSAAALEVFALCLIPFSVIMIIARGLYAVNGQRYDLIANACGVTVFLGSALILIPTYGAVGAATAQLIALITMAAFEVGCISKVLAGFAIWRRRRRFAVPSTAGE